MNESAPGLPSLSDEIASLPGRDRAERERAERVPTERDRPEREPLWRHMLGARLRMLRHERDERLTETARNAGVSSQYLSEVERGTKEPSSEVIAAVAGALEVTLLDLTVAVADDLRSAQSGLRRGASCAAVFALAA